MSLRNKVSNPTALQIQNELRLYAQNVGGEFSVMTEQGITETKYEIEDTRVRLFEREDSAYLKINVPSEDDHDFDDIGNYDLDDITEIEFSEEPHRIYLFCEEEGNYDWGLRTMK